LASLNVRQLSVLGAADVTDGELVTRAHDGRYADRRDEADDEQPGGLVHRFPLIVTMRTREHQLEPSN